MAETEPTSPYVVVSTAPDRYGEVLAGPFDDIREAHAQMIRLGLTGEHSSPSRRVTLAVETRR